MPWGAVWDQAVEARARKQQGGRNRNFEVFIWDGLQKSALSRALLKVVYRLSRTGSVCRPVLVMEIFHEHRFVRFDRVIYPIPESGGAIVAKLPFHHRNTPLRLA